MTNKEQIISFLATSIEICDDCLSESTGVRPRQTVYAICRDLSSSSTITRHNGKCIRCRKIKLVSLLHSNNNSPEIIGGSSNLEEVRIDSSRKVNWFWEGNVQAKVIDYLVNEGYMIRSVADTALRTPGKDIVAYKPNGEELWVSVKGYPEKSSNTQARHWFSGAIFDLLLYRGEDINAKLAIALPDGFVTYLNLLPKIKWLKETMPFYVFWVSEDGIVRFE
jgi:hypothetical protein